MVTVMTDNLATKEDIDALRRNMQETNVKVDGMNVKVNGMNDKLQEVIVKVEGMSVKIDNLASLLKWMLAVGGGGMIAITTAVVTFMLQRFITS